MTSASQKIWLITGVSSGFGRCLMEAAIAKGDYPIGTLRKPEQVAAFHKDYGSKAQAVLLDVDQPQQISKAVQEILRKHKRIDVLVNNAGYGLFGAVEEASEQEIRDQMATNFFGPLLLTQAVLPSMREHKSGMIIQISSIAGFTTTPGLGIYNASKFALEGFSEALAIEVAPLGIKVVIVEPGPFRTKWAGGGSRDVAKSIADYDATAHATMKMIHGYDGNQPGDPVKAARLIAEVTASPNPPLRLTLGKAAIERFHAKLKSLAQNLSAWEKAGLATDF